MRSIESKTRFIVDIMLNDNDNSDNNFKVDGVHLENSHSYGEKISAKYTINNTCSCVTGASTDTTKNAPCPVDLTLCTEICNQDFEFGKVHIGKKNELYEKLFKLGSDAAGNPVRPDDVSSVEGIKLSSSFNGINFELVSGVAASDACLDLFGSDILAITLCGDYCGYGWEVSHKQVGDENDTAVRLYTSYENFNIVAGSNMNGDTLFGIETEMRGARVAFGYDGRQSASENQIAAAVQMELDECSSACLTYKHQDVKARLIYE